MSGGVVIRVDFAKKKRARTRKRLTTEEYRRRDYPQKCQSCGRWMRSVPTSERYVERRPVPHADRCVHCALRRPCRIEREDRCEQCKNLVKDARTAVWHEIQEVAAP